MTVRTVDLQSKQDIAIEVSGPDDITRMLVYTGTVGIGYLGAGLGELTETFVFDVGPPLTPAQFRRAIATASLAKITINNPGAGNGLATWSIDSVDADWDDESQRVQVRVEVTITNAHTGTHVVVQRVAYHVTILASL